MISRVLFGRELRSNYKMFLIFLAVLTMYASMITSMFDPKLGDSLKAMMESMPDIFAAFGMQNPGSTLIEFLANYLYGFLFMVFPLIFFVLMSNRLVVRYVDRGSMAYLLATPNKRSKLVLTQAVFALVAAVCMVLYLTVLCIGLGGALFPGELDITRFVLLNTGLLGLHVFFLGICFCTSCIFNDSKYATGIGAGLPIAFILIQMVSQVGEKFDFLKYCTPLSLFQPDQIIAGEPVGIWSFLILFVAGLVLFAVGIGMFCKRDIPV